MSYDRQATSLAPKFPLRVLLVEDNSADAEHYIEFLSVAQFDLTADVVQTPGEFVDRLQHASYDVILADYNPASWRGTDALNLLREEGCDVPFILLTNGLSDQTVADCVRRGLTDCVLKDRLERLPMTIYRALEEKAARNERRRAARVVEETEAKFRALAESTPAAIFLEHNTRCTYVNGAAELITGYGRNELLETSFCQLIPPELRQNVFGQIHYPRSAKLPVRCQTRITTKSGAERWLDCTVRPIQLEGRLGALIAAVPIPEPSEHRSAADESARIEFSERSKRPAPALTLVACAG